jgi:hypothetical protein
MGSCCYVFNITCMKIHNETNIAELYIISFLNLGSKSPSLYQYTYQRQMQHLDLQPMPRRVAESVPNKFLI